MSFLEIEHLEKSFGATRVVKDFNLSIEKGEFVSLLGPSGCGKTTVLRMVAGFETPSTGAIRIDGRDVVSLRPNQRNIGMVFQSYALFPNLTVAQNVAFGLRMRRIERSAMARRVAEALALVRLHHLGDRYPRQLSGGQQQRVALARALVIHPEILLLDEPLSNLDAKLRQEMRVELVGILKAVGITTIFVTHDQDEALSLADRVVLMNAGRIEQVGTPVEVYEEPATAFVAKFLGEPNVLAARVASVAGGEIACELDGGYRVVSERKASVQVGDRVEVIVRAERVRLARGPSGLPNSFPARLEHVMYLGGDLRYLIQLGPHRLTAVEKNRGDGDVPVAGQTLHVEWPARESLVAAAPPAA